MNRPHLPLMLAGLLTLCPALMAPAQQGQQGPDETGQDQPAQVAVRLHFEVLELTLSEEQIARIDTSPEPLNVQNLTTEGLKDGRAHRLHVFDTPLLVGDKVKLTSGARVLNVRGTTFTETGQAQAHLHYLDVGCILKDWHQHGCVRLSGEAELTSLERDGGVAVAIGVTAPVISTIEQEFDTIIEFGSEVFVSTLSSRSEESDGRTTRAYVYRIRLSRESDT